MFANSASVVFGALQVNLFCFRYAVHNCTVGFTLKKVGINNRSMLYQTAPK